MSRTAPRYAKRPTETATRRPSGRDQRGGHREDAHGGGVRQAPAPFVPTGRSRRSAGDQQARTGMQHSGPGRQRRSAQVSEDALLHEVGSPNQRSGSHSAGAKSSSRGLLGAVVRIGSSLPALLIAGVVLVGVLFIFVFPTNAYFEQRNRTLEAQNRLTALERENAALDARAAELRTPGGIERQARERHGMVKTGEEAYVVGRPSADSVQPAAPAPAPPSWWQRVKKVFGAA